MERTLQVLRIFQIAMLVALMMYIVLAQIAAPARHPANSIVFYAVAACAIAMVFAMFIMRKRTVCRAEYTLASQPDDAAALLRWRTGYVATYALCEGLGLYGLVLRFLGFSLSQVTPFYVVAFVLILFFTPRRPARTIG